MESVRNLGSIFLTLKALAFRICSQCVPFIMKIVKIPRRQQQDLVSDPLNLNHRAGAAHLRALKEQAVFSCQSAYKKQTPMCRHARSLYSRSNTRDALIEPPTRVHVSSTCCASRPRTKELFLAAYNTRAGPRTTKTLHCHYYSKRGWLLEEHNAQASWNLLASRRFRSGRL